MVAARVGAGSHPDSVGAPQVGGPEVGGPEVGGPEEGTEEGFTLIELMVVLLIMAVLLAIALPTFLGVKANAQERSAQSDLVNAAISAKTVFANDGTFTNLNTSAQELQLMEPEMTFTTNQVTSSPVHSIMVVPSPDNQVLMLVDQSVTGRCWAVEVNEEASPGQSVPSFWTSTQGISYGGTKTSAGVQTFCRASAPTLNPGNFTGWGSSFPR